MESKAKLKIMDAISMAAIALLGSKNPIKEYRHGLPCMLGEVVGKIVGESDDGSWGEVNGVKMYSIVLFATPHGSVIKTGVRKLSEITEEGLKKLEGYEDELKSKGETMYNGMLNEF